MVVELVGRVLQAVEEAVARSAVFHFSSKGLLELACVDFADAGREDNAFALLDVHFEVARYVEVFIEVVATFLLLRILDATIPVGLEMEGVFLVELHEEFGITRVHAGLDTVLNLLVFAAGLCVFMGVLAHAAESQEGAEAQGGSRVGIYQCVTNQNTVFMVHEDFLFAQDYTSNTVSCSRYMFAVKFADILVSVGTVVVSLIFVQPQVKLCTMLNYCFV